MSILGKFELVSSENFDEYMKSLGVGLIQRKLANSVSPVLTIVENGGDYTMTSATTVKTIVTKFRLGEQFDEERADGTKCKSTLSLEGTSKLVHKQEVAGKPTNTIIREFSEKELKINMDSGAGVTSVRIYKRV